MAPQFTLEYLVKVGLCTALVMLVWNFWIKKWLDRYEQKLKSNKSKMMLFVVVYALCFLAVLGLWRIIVWSS